MLILAGNDTTMNLMYNIAICLIDHSDQERLVRAQPYLVPAGVEGDAAVRTGDSLESSSGHPRLRDRWGANPQRRRRRVVDWFRES